MVFMKSLLTSFDIRTARCTLHLDREISILPVGSCACARGVAGHLLTAQAPEMTKQFFKPGQGGNAPAAFVLRPDSFSTGRGQSFSFMVFSWEPGGAFLDALLDAWAAARGRPWGETGARITGFETSGPERLVFEGIAENISDPLRLHLLTPLSIKTHVRDRPAGPDGRVRSRRRVLRSDEITLGRIVQALVARVNNIGAHFGGGVSLDPEPLLAKAALVRENGRNLRMTKARRHSSSQKKDIHLDGVTGWIDLDPVPPQLHDLLALGAVFHLGHRTADGCGCLGIEPVESMQRRE